MTVRHRLALRLGPPALLLALSALAGDAGAVSCDSDFACVPPTTMVEPGAPLNAYESGLSVGDVVRLQDALGQLGLYSGLPTGELNAETRAAWRAFLAADTPVTGEALARLDEAATRVAAKLGIDTYANSHSTMAIAYPAALLTNRVETADGFAEFRSDNGIILSLWPYKLPAGQRVDHYFDLALHQDLDGYEIRDSGITQNYAGIALGYYVEAANDESLTYTEFFQSGSRLHGFVLIVPRRLEPGPLYAILRHTLSWSFQPFGPAGPQDVAEGIGVEMP